MAIEKMSIEELEDRMEVILGLLDVGSEVIKASDFTVTLTDKEVRALSIGAECAVAFICNFFLGRLDDSNPEGVAKIRGKSALEQVAILIHSAADTYHHFFVAEDGE